MNSTELQQKFNLYPGIGTKETHQPINRRLCCEKCRFSTKDIKLFERHVSHHEEVTFACNLCNHISYSRVESQRHIVKHKGSYPYKCSWCSYGAVRRDYMVKHIQRIHGKTAEESFTIDYPLSSTTNKHLCQTETKDPCVDTTKILGGPGQEVKDERSSTGNVSHFLTDTSRSRPDVLYLVGKTVQQPTGNQISSSRAQAATSIPCSFTFTKSLPCIVPNTVHTVTKGITNPPNPMGKMTVAHVNRVSEKTRLDTTATTNALPRICVGISGERTTQQMPLFQSTLGRTSEKTTIQPKPLPKIQVKLPVGNHDHQKTILRNALEGSEPQTPAISGFFTPISQMVHRAVTTGSNSNPQPVAHGAQKTEKIVRQRTRPNILVNPLSRKKLSEKPSVQVGVPISLNQPIQQNKSLVVTTPEKSCQNSNVQVELLSPLNQPIQHNKPLTVSCPEEITIPAGCLVELVEVKNVNGSRELELRLVPQQLARPQVAASKSTTSTATPNDKVSFKCRVAADDGQSSNFNHGISSPTINSIKESFVNGTDLRKLSTNIKVTVKNEPEINVHSVNKNFMHAQGSSSRNVPGALKPLACKQPELNKAHQQLRFESKKVLNDPILGNSLQQLHFKGLTNSLKASNENISSKGLTYELKPTQASVNKCKDSESGYQGLPVISSVFSLCPVSQRSSNHTPTRDPSVNKKDGKARVSLNLLPRKSSTNLEVCKPYLIPRAETSVLAKTITKCGQQHKGNGGQVKDTKPLKGTNPRKKVDQGYQAFSNKNNNITKLCNSTVRAPHTLPVSSVIIYPSQHASVSTQKMDKPLQSENCSSVQKVGANPIGLSMNPTVALVRMPSLEFFSRSECAKRVPEKADSEESITARPVLCCALNQQNFQDKSIKLVLKRKRIDSDSRHCVQDPKLGLPYVDSPPAYKRVRKHKKRTKKCKFLKVQEIVEQFKKGTISLLPLRHDQPVKLPGPNQPVVVLNHPTPLLKVIRLKGPTFNEQEHLHLPNGNQTDGERSSLKMKLKRIQGQSYEVTELVLKGVSEKTIF